MSIVLNLRTALKEAASAKSPSQPETAPPNANTAGQPAPAAPSDRFEGLKAAAQKSANGICNELRGPFIETARAAAKSLWNEKEMSLKDVAKESLQSFAQSANTKAVFEQAIPTVVEAAGLKSAKWAAAAGASLPLAANGQIDDALMSVATEVGGVYGAHVMDATLFGIRENQGTGFAIAQVVAAGARVTEAMLKSGSSSLPAAAKLAANSKVFMKALPIVGNAMSLLSIADAVKDVVNAAQSKAPMKEQLAVAGFLVGTVVGAIPSLSFVGVGVAYAREYYKTSQRLEKETAASAADAPPAPQPAPSKGGSPEASFSVATDGTAQFSDAPVPQQATSSVTADGAVQFSDAPTAQQSPSRKESAGELIFSDAPVMQRPVKSAATDAARQVQFSSPSEA